MKSIDFVVSSYSSPMMLSLAKIHPEKISKAVLLVPSGIAHGSIMPIIQKQMIPFITYAIKPTKERLRKVFEPMMTEEVEVWYEFFNLILTEYKMELRSPREFKKSEMLRFKAPLFIISAKQDIFFPPKQVLSKAKEIFNCNIEEKIIEGKHLLSFYQWDITLKENDEPIGAMGLFVVNESDLCGDVEHCIGKKYLGQGNEGE